MTAQPAADTMCARKSSSFLGPALVFLLLALGAAVRGYDFHRHFVHTDDIGVAKTIIDYKISRDWDPFAVGKHWTYAPLQFVLTWFLVTPEQTYRELLFWGRLPSLAAGILGLAALIWFYRTWQGRQTPSLPFALAILAFSWENIIFAKQMHNYALGVTAAVLLLTLLAANLAHPAPSRLRAAASGLAIGALAWMHYQLLFLAPAYFAALLFHHARNHRPQLAASARGAAVSGAALLAAVVPMYWFFLRRHAGLVPVDWARGPGWEYDYFLHGGMTLAGKVTYTISFFLRNGFLMLQSNLSFLPQGHPLFVPVSVLLAALLAIGAWRLAASRRPEQVTLAVCLAVMLATWAAMVAIRRLPWGPTRHALVLAPILAITVSEGVSWMAEKFRLRWAQAVASLLAAGLFAAAAPGALAERRDPFEEAEIVSSLETYQVDTLITAFETLQPDFMKGVRDYFKYYALGFVQWELYVKKPPRYDTIAWLSHRDDLNEATFERAKERIAYYNVVRGRTDVPAFTEALSAYEVIFRKAVSSRVEIEALNLTQNGANNLYFYILKKKKQQQ